MNFIPNEAPTEFLRSYGEFLLAIKNEDHGKADRLLVALRNLSEVTGKERILLMLGDELLQEHIETTLQDVIDEYFEQIDAARSGE